ncbi:MAG: hypothetical protein MJZ11_14055 [Lachnospiraceae bacterium]|nr:hypothetical protein [Lachnospiraceae bacterium]
MKGKYILFKESLKENVVFNKKEYLLTLTVCILGGILFGMILSPFRSLTIGSFNGNGWGTSPDEDSDDDCSLEQEK